MKVSGIPSHLHTNRQRYKSSNLAELKSYGSRCLTLVQRQLLHPVADLLIQISNLTCLCFSWIALRPMNGCLKEQRAVCIFSCSGRVCVFNLYVSELFLLTGPDLGGGTLPVAPSPSLAFRARIDRRLHIITKISRTPAAPPPIVLLLLLCEFIRVLECCSNRIVRFHNLILV